MPTIVSTETQVVSPWVTLVNNHVRNAAGDIEVYSALRQADYVSVLAVSADGRVPLVEQFRPAVGRRTLELPGGLVDPQEPPLAAVRRELAEETGVRAPSEALRCLGELWPDTGRLQNRLWAYFAHPVDAPLDFAGEPGVLCRWLSLSELRAAMIDGRFNHALHVAIVGLAQMHGLFDWAMNEKIVKATNNS